MRDLLRKDKLWELLFNVMPVLALVVDSDGRVYAINDAVKNLLGQEDNEKVIMKTGGEVLHCIHRKDDPQGCGFGPQCRKCIMRRGAMRALQGDHIQREKGDITYEFHGEIKKLDLLVSSVSFEYDNKKYAIVIAEDISNIIELRSLIPICSKCKKIRDDAGYWEQIERYIKRHNYEIDFTHDLCPDCLHEIKKSLIK